MPRKGIGHHRIVEHGLRSAAFDSQHSPVMASFRAQPFDCLANYLPAARLDCRRFKSRHASVSQKKRLRVVARAKQSVPKEGRSFYAGAGRD